MMNLVFKQALKISNYQTERIKHQITLQKLHVLLNNSDESFYFLDSEMKFVSFNREAKMPLKLCLM